VSYRQLTFITISFELSVKGYAKFDMLLCEYSRINSDSSAQIRAIFAEIQNFFQRLFLLTHPVYERVYTVHERICTGGSYVAIVICAAEISCQPVKCDGIDYQWRSRNNCKYTVQLLLPTRKYKQSLSCKSNKSVFFGVHNRFGTFSMLCT